MSRKSPRVLFVTPYEPNSVGNGGQHRSYQIVYDLEQTVGPENVSIIYYYEWFFAWQAEAQKRASSAQRVDVKSSELPPTTGPASGDSEFAAEKLTSQSLVEFAARDWRPDVKAAWTKLRDRVQLRTRLRRRLMALRDRLQWRTRVRKYMAKQFRLIYPEMRLPPELAATASGVQLAMLDDPVQRNIFQGLYHTKYHSERFSRPEFLDYYGTIVERIKPDVVVIEDSEMAGVIDYNRRNHIPTIACPQNYEALIVGELPDSREVWRLHAHLYDLATELTLLSRCDRRLFISKVEAGFAQGLGYPSQFYPYRPVGAIRDRLESVYHLRSSATITRGLFILIGSAHYPPIRDGLKWFVEGALNHGLPPGVHVVGVGAKTDELLPRGTHVPGLELKGWVEQDDLDRLMQAAHCILVPYCRGFGALTRLSEFPLTGIPILASRFATLSVEPHANVYPVDEDWGAWYTAMQNMLNGKLAAEVSPQPIMESGDSVLKQAILSLLGLPTTVADGTSIDGRQSPQ